MHRLLTLFLALALIAPFPLHTAADEIQPPEIARQAPQIIAFEATESPVQYFTDTDAKLIAQTLYGECRGSQSVTEQACVVWTILNRSDAWGMSIKQIVTARYQFSGYKANNPVWDDLLSLSYDVLERWNNEKNGQADVGRVLPKDYCWFTGNGKHNYFRNQYKGGTSWNYSLISPYTT